MRITGDGKQHIAIKKENCFHDKLPNILIFFSLCN